MAVGIAVELLRKQTRKTAVEMSQHFMEIKRWHLNYSFLGYWMQYLLVNKFKYSLEDNITFELPFDICKQNCFVQSAGLFTKVTCTDKNVITKDNK